LSSGLRSELSTIAVISRRESFRRVKFHREFVTVNVGCISKIIPFLHSAKIYKTDKIILYFKSNDKIRFYFNS